MNVDQTARGQLGVAVALLARTSFSKGSQPLVVVDFKVIGSQSGAYPIRFGDFPMPRGIVDIHGRSLNGVLEHGEIQFDATPPSLTAQLREDGSVTLDARGLPGRRYQSEVSTDLKTWSTLGTAAIANDGTARITDSQIVVQSSRCYRLVR